MLEGPVVELAGHQLVGAHDWFALIRAKGIREHRQDSNETDDCQFPTRGPRPVRTDLKDPAGTSSSGIFTILRWSSSLGSVLSLSYIFFFLWWSSFSEMSTYTISLFHRSKSTRSLLRASLLTCFNFLSSNLWMLKLSPLGEANHRNALTTPSGSPVLCMNRLNPHQELVE